MSVDLGTTYLGLKLKNPVVVSASPLSERLDVLKRLEDAGAAAAVLPSLFQEQIEHDVLEAHKLHAFGTESFAEALDYFPELDDYNTGPERYLELIDSAKKAVSIPIIGIGAGRYTDGQVLVFHDMLGLFDKFLPKFVKQYAKIGDDIVSALAAYRDEVRQGAFPADQHVFSGLSREDLEGLRKP